MLREVFKFSKRNGGKQSPILKFAKTLLKSEKPGKQFQDVMIYKKGETYMNVSMPLIKEYEVRNCAYNGDNKCHAAAINVGGPGEACPSCDTFFQASSKGGKKKVIAGVGACKFGSCKFNELFECVAKSVQIKMHENHADCATFMAR